jgi:hypothetical protein
MKTNKLILMCGALAGVITATAAEFFFLPGPVSVPFPKNTTFLGLRS